MQGKPRFLFLTITPPEYAPANLSKYNTKRTFELNPHKHSILALVAWLRENGCEGYYRWIEPGDPDGFEKIERAVEEIQPHGIGFSLTTEEIIPHYPLIVRLKGRFRHIPIIVGGHHVTAEPLVTIENFPFIDYVCIGEGEKTLEEWLKKVAAGAKPSDMRSVSGIAFYDEKGRTVVTPPREKFTDINVLPDPAFDLILSDDVSIGKFSAFPLVTSYGCRYYCTFCAADHGNYRYMSPERVVSQIENAQKKYGAEYFAFRDSFWPPTSQWLEKFCDLIEERGIKFRFHFETRAGSLDERQMARLKRIGARAIAVGVESGDPGVLKLIRKAITVDMVKKTFDQLHRTGLLSVAFFMVGNQGENPATIRASEELASEINPTLLDVSTLRPFPGTEAYRLVRPDQRDWWMAGKDVSICDLPVTDLHRMRADFHIRYPLRWGYLSRNVVFSRLPMEFRQLAWFSFLNHLRRYILGICERYGPLRCGIYNLKKLMKPTRIRI
jgi:magnesium-protoporphyrin IX monomethyl ester (oxidative) cyclase